MLSGIWTSSICDTKIENAAVAHFDNAIGRECRPTFDTICHYGTSPGITLNHKASKHISIGQLFPMLVLPCDSRHGIGHAFVHHNRMRNTRNRCGKIQHGFTAARKNTLESCRIILYAKRSRYVAAINLRSRNACNCSLGNADIASKF